MKRNVLLLLALLAGCNGSTTIPAGPGSGSSPWAGFAGTAQHAADSNAQPQALNAIHWRVTVDASPPSLPNFNAITAHYGSPVITPANTAIVPVKTTAAGGYGVEAHSGNGGTLLWKFVGDYTPPYSLFA